MSLPEKKEGRMTACPECGDPIVCEMSSYPPESGYKNYLQWKNTKDKTPHSKTCKKSKPGPKASPGGTEENLTSMMDKAPTEQIRIPEVLSDMHDLCWAFANIEAAKAWPVKIKASQGFPSIDVNEKSRNILAQVFYKELMPAYRKLKFQV
ncbi:MAG: hypothetical protein ACXADH_01095 [Candidatus Kariarchaeaceae archaeon]|jgi:hypothetical protein